MVAPLQVKRGVSRTTGGEKKAMRIVLVTLGGLVVVAGVVLFVLTIRGAQARRTPTPEAAALMMQLRDRVLRGSARQFSIEPRNGVWGVVMETGYRDAAVSLVALADGNASLYFSSGGGVIGGIGHASVRSAAVRLCELAAEHVAATQPTTEFPLPPEGVVRFYLLTDANVRSSESAETTLGEAKHALSPLYFAGQDVITQLRLTVQQGGG